MTLLYDGDRCFFREESEGLSDSVLLRLPFNCTVVVDGRTRVTPRNGIALIPVRFLKEGVNTLTLRKEHRTIPAEGLYLENGLVRPAGFSARDTAASLSLWCHALEKRLTETEAALAKQRAELPTLLFS